MSMVMIKCPTSGRPIATGIEVEEGTFSALPDVPSRARCPHCGLDHVWWKRDSWIDGQSKKTPD